MPLLPRGMFVHFCPACESRGTKCSREQVVAQALLPARSNAFRRRQGGARPFGDGSKACATTCSREHFVPALSAAKRVASRRGTPMAELALFLGPRTVSVAPLCLCTGYSWMHIFCHHLLQAIEQKHRKHSSARPPAFLAAPCLLYAQARQAVSARSQLIVETSYPGQDSISIYNMQNI
nr:MAG: hypothetical protein [Molluscum contagiosum virus]